MDSLSRLGPAATALVALVALIVGVVTVRQRGEADRRDQWWKRAQWAIDHALDDRSTDHRTAGLKVLGTLSRSRLARDEELELLASLGLDELTELAPTDELLDDDVGGSGSNQDEEGQVTR